LTFVAFLEVLRRVARSARLVGRSSLSLTGRLIYYLIPAPLYGFAQFLNFHTFTHSIRASSSFPLSQIIGIASFILNPLKSETKIKHKQISKLPKRTEEKSFIRAKNQINLQKT